MITALALALIVHLQAPCPLRVDEVTEYGLAFNVALKNRADYPVRLTALHVTFTDPLGQCQERTYRYKALVQPKQALKLLTPVVTGVIVQWETAAASAVSTQLCPNVPQKA